VKVRSWWIGVGLLLGLWATRVWALELLPLHNDEGLHLTRAVEVWHLHPFWAISDGKIINHWLIAAFYPQHEAAFAGRIATVLVSLVGLAAGYALTRRVIGSAGAFLTGMLWIANPYLFFYERLAFSDAEAGALALAALWAAWRTRAGTGWRGSVLTGVLLGLAALFKFTAVPYAASVALILLVAGGGTLRERALRLAVVGLVTAACFVVPLAYLAVRGDDFFGIALGWIGGSGEGQASLVGNLARLGEQLRGFGSLTWVILSGAGLALLVVMGVPRRAMLALVGAGVLPLALMLVLGTEVLSRHFVVVIPGLVTLAGMGLGYGLRRIGDRRSLQLVAGMGATALVFGVIPFMLTAYTTPAELPLPADARYEHITSHSSGYGLREAAEGLGETITQPELRIVGSMFPDSCRRTNFYAPERLQLLCDGAPGMGAIEAALAADGAVYVLADHAPIIGVDVNTVGARATAIAVYARPDETAETASVVLWLLERE